MIKIHDVKEDDHIILQELEYILWNCGCMIKIHVAKEDDHL